MHQLMIHLCHNHQLALIYNHQDSTNHNLEDIAIKLRVSIHPHTAPVVSRYLLSNNPSSNPLSIHHSMGTLINNNENIQVYVCASFNKNI